MPEMQKKLGVTSFVSEIRRVENYPDFDKLAHVIQHGLQWFIVKNIEGKSTEANELSLNCPRRVLAQTAKTRGGTFGFPAYRV